MSKKTKDDDEPGVIAFRLHYFHTYQDLTVALLCSQLHYWYSPTKEGNSRLGVYKLGKWWVCKSHVEWTQETGLSRMQVRRALGIMEASGLIETEVHRFHNIPTLHIRAFRPNGNKPLMKGEHLTDIPLKLGNASPPLVTHNHPLVTGSQPITETTTKTTKKCLDSTNEETKETSALSSAEETTNAISKGAPIPGGKSMKKPHSTADELLKKYKAAKQAPIAVSNASPAGMYRLWAQAVPRYNESVQFIAPFTMKQMGQVKRLSKLWSTPDAPKVLHAVCERWISFTKYAEKHAGAFNSPEAPTIDYVCRYAEAAKNWWLAKDAKQEKIGTGTKTLPGQNPSLESKLDKSPKVLQGTYNSKHCPHNGDAKTSTSDEGDSITTLEDVMSYKLSKGSKHGSSA